MRASANRVALALLVLTVGLRAEDSLQKQVDDLKARVKYIQDNYERSEPVEIVKPVTEFVSPTGELFTTRQPGDVSPTDGSRLEERVSYRKMKFNRREAVGEKIDAAVSSAIDGHVIVGLELVGTYLNTVGAGDFLDPTGTTRNANTGSAMGSLDISLTGKPMRNTLMFVDLDGASGTMMLSEAWLSVQGPKKVLSLQAGVIDVTGTFDSNRVANDETSQFLTPDFVNSPLLGNPANGPGAIARVDFTRFQFMAGAQNALATGTQVTDDLYFIAEAGMLQHFFGDAHLRAWARQQPRGSQQPDQAVGLSADHRFNPLVTAFARYAKNSYVESYDEATDTRVAINLLDWAASGGLELTNFYKPNLKARVGLAYGRTAAQDTSSMDSAELYARVPLTPNLACSLHYLTSFSIMALGPMGLEGMPATHTVGLRVQSAY